ncbi:hypothetical protein BC629DRAFT_913834 [Irpex lacteus]|nr:hypothetical protein BC629DRAFT_913834 [Irpex lacteus]
MFGMLCASRFIPWLVKIFKATHLTMLSPNGPCEDVWRVNRRRTVVSGDTHELWGVRSLRLLLLLVLLAYSKRHYSQRARRRRLKPRRTTVVVIVAFSGISILDAAHSCNDPLTGTLQRLMHCRRFAS